MPSSPSNNHPPNASNPRARRQLFPEDKSEISHLAVAGYEFCSTLGAGGIGEAFLYKKIEDNTFWVLKKPREDVATLRNKLKALPLDFQAANEAMVASSALKGKSVKPNRTVKHFNAINGEFGLPAAHAVTVAGINYMMAPYIGPEEKVSSGATVSYPKATLADYLAVQVRLAKTDGRIVVDVDLYLPIAALSEEKTQQREEKQFGSTISPSATAYVNRTRPAQNLLSDEIRPAPRLTKALGSELCAAYSQAMQVILAFFRIRMLAVVPADIRNTVLDTLVKIAEKPRWDDTKKKKAFERIWALVQHPAFLEGLSAIKNKSGWSDNKKKTAFQAVFALIQPKTKGLFSAPDEQIKAFCQLLPLAMSQATNPLQAIKASVSAFKSGNANEVLDCIRKKYQDRASYEQPQEGHVATVVNQLALKIPSSQSLSNKQTRTPGGKAVYEQSGVLPKKVGDGKKSPPEAASSQVVEIAAAGSVAILLTAAEGVAAYFEAISAPTSAFAPWIIAGQVVGGIALLALGYHVTHRPTETEAQGPVLG